MKKISIKPSAELAPYIDRYWGRSSSSPGDNELPDIIPGTGIEIYFHSLKPFSCIGPSETIYPAASHLVCNRTKHFSLYTDSAVDFISVRFKAGMFRYFSNLPFKEFTDSFIPLSLIWGAEGDELARKVIAAPAFEKKARLLDSGLRAFLLRESGKNPIDYAVERLYYSYRDINLESLSAACNLSRRHLNRLFTAEIGVTPKYFHRTARFEQTIKKLLLSGRTGYLQTALDAGYYDQSHFIKECREFTGLAPHDFLKDRNFMSHFYNTKLV